MDDVPNALPGLRRDSFAHADKSGVSYSDGSKASPLLHANEQTPLHEDSSIDNVRVLPSSPDSEKPLKTYLVEGKSASLTKKEFDNMVDVFATLLRWQKDLDSRK